MYDINYFRIYKKRKAKSNGLKIFIAVFLLFLVLFNLLVVGGGLVFTRGLENQIAEKNTYINSPDTIEKIATANRLRQEADLTSAYLKALQNASDGFAQINIVDTVLLNQIRAMIPASTAIESSQINGNTVQLNCISTNANDPIAIYHALLNNSYFTNVSFGGYITDPGTGFSVFGIDFQVAGGIKP